MSGVRITVSLWRKNESWGQPSEDLPRDDGSKERDGDGDENKHEISESERTKKGMSELNCPLLDRGQTAGENSGSFDIPIWLGSGQPPAHG